MRTPPRLPILLLVALAGCQKCPAPHESRDSGMKDTGPFDAGTVTGPCALPGSWIHNDTGFGPLGPDPADSAPMGVDDPHEIYPGTWLTIPHGFCAHHYATVPNARQIRFAPGGELFVASPTTGTTGGGAGGLSSIVVVPDDNNDGEGDSLVIFANSLPSTQGLLFANGSFYFQNGTTILSEPYVSGQRADNGQSMPVVNITNYSSGLHWPKTLDISDQGQIFVGNGGDQQETCSEPGGTSASMPVHGGIVLVDGSAGGNPIVQGMRNPIAVKCHRDGNDLCFSTELALDYSASAGGREKLVTIHAGDNWGFPCCASANLPYSSVSPKPDCSTVQQDVDSFLIGNTPFGFDFEDAQFPGPWDHHVLVALHGTAGQWTGARIAAIAFNPSTGAPLPGTNIDGTDSGAMVDFATGWDDNTFKHGRPADIDFSPDGRMFVANDTNGEIFWIAAVTTE